MKSRIIWAAILLAAIAGFYIVTIQPTHTQSLGFSRKRPPLRHLAPPEIAPPALPSPVFTTPNLLSPLLNPQFSLSSMAPGAGASGPPRLEMPVQDDATVGLLTGPSPINLSGKDQEALDRVLKAMADATKDVTIPAPKK